MGKTPRKGASSNVKLEAKPKLTRQGQGQRSKPNHGRKRTRGQGR